ncbi:MAG: Rpn family recombination-promoting nuclease/putative transposase [bacterium]
MQIISTTSDLGFKTVFGERPHLLMNLLNNFLPLPNPIVEVHYLNPEMIPEKTDGKNGIVDVHCKDSHERHFIVEMQIGQQASFIKRALLNTSKVYSRQLTKEQQYHLAQPVYSLNLLDHRIDEDETIWYHHYALTNQQDSAKTIDQMHILLIELPKWKNLNKFDIELPRDRWLVYFTEPKYFTMMTKEELKRFNEISEAVELLEPTNFTPEQLRAYDLYLDNIRTYESNMYEAKLEAFTDGEAKGILKGSNQTLSIMKDLKDSSNNLESISEKYGVSVEFVREVQSVMG